MTNFLKRFLTRGMAEAQEKKPQKPEEITEPVFALVKSIKEDKGRWKLYLNGNRNGVSIEKKATQHYLRLARHGCFLGDYTGGMEPENQTRGYLLDTKTGVKVDFLCTTLKKVNADSVTILGTTIIKTQYVIDLYGKFEVIVPWATFEENWWMRWEIGNAIQERSDAIFTRLRRERVRKEAAEEALKEIELQNERKRVMGLFCG